MWLWSAFKKRRLERRLLAEAKEAVSNLGCEVECDKARDLLKKMPAATVTPLLIEKLLYDDGERDVYPPPPAIARRAAILLSEMGDPQAIEPLSRSILAGISEFDGIHPTVGAEALLAFGAQGADAAVEALSKLAAALPADAYGFKRASVAEGMALLHDERLLPSLEALLAQEQKQDEPDWQAKCIITKGLYECGAAEGLIHWMMMFMSGASHGLDYAESQFWRRTLEQLTQTENSKMAEFLAPRLIEKLKSMGTTIEWASKTKPTQSALRTHTDDRKEAARDALIAIRDSEKVVLSAQTRDAVEEVLGQVKIRRR